MNTCIVSWTAVVLMFIAIGSGCTTSSNVAEVYSVAGPAGMIEVRKNVVVNRPWLAQRLEFGEMRTRKTGDFLDVQVDVTNTQSKTRQIEYSVEWYDADGFRIEAVGSSWKPKVVYGKQTVQLQSVAPTAAATTAKVFVRAPTPVSE